MSIINAFPTTIVNGQLEDATVVMSLFNWIQSQVNANAAPTGTAGLGGVSIGSFSIDNSTSPGSGAGRAVYASTNPSGWNTGVGRMTFDTEFICNSYFTLNPGGHIALCLRQDPSLVATAARGQGVAIGNATGFTYPTVQNPSPVPETWFNGIGIGSLVYPNGGVEAGMPMADGVGYRVIVDSTMANDGNRYLRHRFYTRGTYGEWTQMVDTGDILDFNTFADLTQSALYIAHVLGANVGGWSIAFTNAKVTWGPAENATPDQTNRLSRYGANLSGNLNFIGNGRTVRFPFAAGPSLVNSPTFQSSTTNAATTLVVKPNGTGVIANHLYSNNSTSSSTYQAMIVGMNAGEASIKTLNAGSTDPNFSVYVGSYCAATFNVYGVNIQGNASKNLGTPINFSANITNFGGTNATTFVTTGTYDVDAACGVGFLATYMGATYNAATVENALRPVWCMLSSLIKELQDKKVI